MDATYQYKISSNRPFLCGSAHILTERAVTCPQLRFFARLDSWIISKKMKIDQEINVEIVYTCDNRAEKTTRGDEQRAIAISKSVKIF